MGAAGKRFDRVIGYHQRGSFVLTWSVSKKAFDRGMSPSSVPRIVEEQGRSQEHMRIEGDFSNGYRG